MKKSEIKAEKNLEGMQHDDKVEVLFKDFMRGMQHCYATGKDTKLECVLDEGKSLNVLITLTTTEEP